MAKKKWLHKILAILPSISLIVILLISSFEIGAYGDWNFYEKEYEGVLSSLNSLKKDLTNSINANQKIVNAFEEFSAIVNNN